MKKAILKAIEDGNSPAKLAPDFGVSKSTIYKYRRALRDQGFIRKNENDIYVITRNKFSTKPQIPETANLNFDYSDEAHTDIQKEIKIAAQEEKEYKEADLHNTQVEVRLQEKLEEIRQVQVEEHNQANEKNIFKKILNKFKKII